MLEQEIFTKPRHYDTKFRRNFMEFLRSFAVRNFVDHPTGAANEALLRFKQSTDHTINGSYNQCPIAIFSIGYLCSIDVFAIT
jgi:hypothetical protein